MIVFLTKDFKPTTEAAAVMAKVIPDNGDAPYFVAVNNGSEQKTFSYMLTTIEHAVRSVYNG